jgi:vacuolar-type H+-ATPase subunit E/Vma4
MGTEELRAAVLQEATAEADGLIEAAAAQASQTVENEKLKLGEYASARVAEFQVMKQREAAAKAAALKIELRNAALKRKQELLEELYREVERTIGETDSLYLAYLEHAAAHIGDEMPVSVECLEDNEPVVTELISRRADAAGISVEPTLPKGERGFVVHFAEAAIDLTLSAACMSLRDNTLVEAAQAMFCQKK